MNGVLERSEMSHVELACSTARADGRRQPKTHVIQLAHADQRGLPPAVLVTDYSDSDRDGYGS